MIDASGTNTYTYTAGNQLLTEDGPFASDTVTNIYVNRLRTKLVLGQPTGVWTNAFAYDPSHRLTNVTSAAGSFAYLYPKPSTLVSRLTLPNTSYITNTFDAFARLSGTYLNNSGNSTLDSYAYTYNSLDQRTLITRADASIVTNSYDPIGQLTNADSSLNTEDRSYVYDAAWNLTNRTVNGSLQSFTVN